MTLYSYIVLYDHGFAPNPFHGFCTLACCKRPMRKSVSECDYVVGLSSKTLGLPYRVVYAMRVSETMTFEEYWDDVRFRAKRPDRRVGGEEAVGDNIYHRDPATGDWVKKCSEHTRPENPEEDKWFTEDDTGTNKVLIGTDFVYWGREGPPLPDHLEHLIVGRNYKCKFSQEEVDAFVKWFNAQERGCLGMPTRPLPGPLQSRRKPRRC